MKTGVRLQGALSELERNLYHLGRYAARVRKLARMVPDSLADPDDAAIEAVDQFVLRFLKTVDAATRRLFPALLEHLGEYEEGMALIDVLNRLEKLGWIDSARRWRIARDRRDQLTHDYPDAPEVRRSILRSALELESMIQSDGARIRKRLQR